MGLHEKLIILSSRYDMVLYNDLYIKTIYLKCFCRVWGTICLSLAFAWQLYTIWLLVNLHESDSGLRYSRFLHLSIAAFGEYTSPFPYYFVYFMFVFIYIYLVLLIFQNCQYNFFKKVLFINNYDLKNIHNNSQNIYIIQITH